LIRLRLLRVILRVTAVHIVVLLVLIMRESRPALGAGPAVIVRARLIFIIALLPLVFDPFELILRKHSRLLFLFLFIFHL
jgi:hypothetical protein